VAATQHPNPLDLQLATRFGVSRRAAQRALQRLVQLQWLVREDRARRAWYRPGALRQVVRRYELGGLAEDVPWTRDFAPYFALPHEVNRMLQHAFCELLNNAIDHSGGTQVTVSVRQTASHVQLLVSDDGLGLFTRIAQTFDIDSPRMVMLELSKGKLTSQPRTHTGQGLFFTSKLADVFDLHANEVAFQRRDWDARGWQSQRALKHCGTSVYASIALDTTRTLDSIRREYALDTGGVAFDRTVVPLRVMTSETVSLESRAQARRVLARLAEFRRAELDFSGVGSVGHAFADELFRVCAHEAAATQIVPVNMSAQVAHMVNSIRATHPGAEVHAHARAPA
jgi:anti-sigma regulatory factor (Ser/Thr protein kinase)